MHWCVTHQTALAEAEVEYAEHTSPSIYVRFPLVPGQAPVEQLLGKTPAALVIWTTTPWTLAANLAVVANPELEYVAIPVTRGGTKEFLVVAKGRAEAFLAACRHRGPAARRVVSIAGAELAAWKGVRYQHPFIAAPKAERDFRLYFARPRHAGGRHRPGAHGARPRRRGLRRRPDRGAGDLRAGRRRAAATRPRSRTGRA